MDVWPLMIRQSATFHDVNDITVQAGAGYSSAAMSSWCVRTADPGPSRSHQNSEKSGPGPFLRLARRKARRHTCIQLASEHS